MSEELFCTHCDIRVDNPTVERIELPNDRFHLKASCPRCGHYLKFLAHDPNAPAVFYFGKLKGLSIIEAVAKDRDYCQWAVESGAAGKTPERAQERAGSHMTLNEIASGYVSLGLSVLPIRPDGSKAPDLTEWKTYEHRLPNADELSRFKNCDGVGIIGGAVSGNLEVFDFDNAPTFHAWVPLIKEYLGQEFFETLTIVRTPRPGYHVYTRCDSIGGNQKLAYVPTPENPKKCIIETKAEGGYVLAPGCPSACHETGRLYELMQGSFHSIPQITCEQREVLFSCARSFNQVFQEAANPPSPPKRNAGKNTIGADFCARASWTEILKPHGFTRAGQRGECELWTRPGKDHGVSASTNHSESNLFYSFSTNCFPFESERGYSKFAVYTLLNCDGDFHGAAKQLAHDGYGTSRPLSKSAQVLPPAPINLSTEILRPETLMDRMEYLYQHGIERGLDPGWQCVRDFWTVRKGEWTLVTGIPSHGKTGFVDSVMLNLARSQKWKWLVFSGENRPEEIHLVNLLELLIGKPFHVGMHSRMTPPEVRAGMDFLAAHFRFLSPPDDEETMERLLELVESDDRQHDGFVFDPWNELTHDYGGDTETDYISKQLKLLGRFVKRNHMHAFVIAHPRIMRKEKGSGSGPYPIPNPYDISGSAHWRNKADNCLCVWRDESEPGKSTLFIQKIRRRFVGKIGKAELNYDVVTGRFSDPNHRITIDEAVSLQTKGFQLREPGQEG